VGTAPPEDELAEEEDDVAAPLAEELPAAEDELADALADALDPTVPTEVDEANDDDAVSDDERAPPELPDPPLLAEVLVDAPALLEAADEDEGPTPEEPPLLELLLPSDRASSSVQPDAVTRARLSTTRWTLKRRTLSPYRTNPR